MPVRELPPGRYVLRAQVSVAAQPLQDADASVRGRGRPHALRTPPSPSRRRTGRADAGPSCSCPSTNRLFAHPFGRDRRVDAEVLQRSAIGSLPTTKPAFERGVSALRPATTDKPRPASRAPFGRNIDSTSLLAYLAACSTRAGQRGQAVGAWQTALDRAAATSRSCTSG